MGQIFGGQNVATVGEAQGSVGLAESRRQIDRYVFLGDYVGYGADPVFAVETVMDHVGRGAIAVLGNHDDAAALVQADHIVIGARGSSALRHYLGSVSAQVGAEAPCTVTVVLRPH